MSSDDGAGLEPCAHCDEPIDPEAAVCPECGNNPGRKAKIAAVVLTIIGVVLVVLNPLFGAPLLILGVFGFIAVHGAHYSATDHDF